jgi:hypothetical protein
MPFIGDPFKAAFCFADSAEIGIILVLSAAQQTAQDKLF